MHDIIPVLTKEDKLRSIGWFAIWWIENFCIIGSPPVTTQAQRFTPEYAEFVVNAYALDKRGRRMFDKVFLARPKGCNKSGLAGLLALFEGFAPCRFDHWAKGGETYTFLGRTYRYRKGEPVGRVIQSPDILCVATAEDQTGNIYDVCYANCTQGPLSRLRGVGLDPGLTRIGLPEGGQISYGTGGASAKDGGKQTFVTADETHLYTKKQVKDMYSTLQRNLAKRSDAEPWILETTTMFRPGENSIAETTFKTAWLVQEGKAKHSQHVLFDHRYSSLSIADLADEKKLRRALMESYGSAMKSPDGYDHLILPDGRITRVNPKTGRDSEGHTLLSKGVEPGPSKDGWCDVDRIMANIYDPQSDVNDSVRYFLNSLTSSSDAWLTEAQIQSHLVGRDTYVGLRSHEVMDKWREFIKPGERITLGFDGSISDDATALVGCRVSDGLLFLVKLAQKPDGPDGAGWRVDRDALDAKVQWMFEHYNVVGFFADVNPWESMIAKWELLYGDRLMVSPRIRGERIRFYTNSWTREVYQNLVTMHGNFEYPYVPATEKEPVIGDIGLLADPRLVDHFRNARRRDRSFGYLIFKETPDSPKKIDAAMAGMLAYAARMKVVGEAEVEEPVQFLPISL